MTELHFILVSAVLVVWTICGVVLFLKHVVSRVP